MKKCWVVGVLFYCVFNVYAQFPNEYEKNIDSVHVHLPDSIYTTSTSKFSIYYTNLIPSEFLNNEQIVVNCSVGYADSMKYNLDSLNAGRYNFNIQIYDSLGSFVEEDNSKIIVTNDTITHNDTLKVLIIGDSFTWMGISEKYIKDFYEKTSNHPIKFLGTKYNTYEQYHAVENGIYHEGYTGKTWYFFANDLLSPFVYDTVGAVDLNRYFNIELNGEKPDVVVIFLGINDIGSGDPSTIETIDLRIDTIFGSSQMTKIINSFVDVLPNAEIGIVLTPPLNEREDTYTNPAIPDYWERKRMHHRLCQRYEDYFKTLNYPKISIIPVNVNIDTYLGFGVTDSIHPNDFGFKQIGYSIYGWLKYQISQWMTEPKNLLISYNTNSVYLNWEQSSGVFQYHIYRSANPYSGFIEIGTSTVTSYTDSNISGSTKYFYKVTADNSVK